MRVVPVEARGAGEGPARALWAALRDYASLTKPRLASLVLFTTAGGMWLSGAKLPWTVWLSAMLGTFGTVGAANALNCYLERESDAYMRRTAGRPLPTHRLEPLPALGFAFVLAVVSLPLLAVGVNLLTGALGLLALLTYVLVYTPLKSRTWLAMLVGAVPGALPPLMGWTAARGKVEWPGLVLFAILFFWQLPHFIAIAMFRKEEYRAAGLTSLPLEKGDRAAWRQAVAYLAVLLPVSLLPYAMHMAGVWYLATALGLGAYFAWVAVQGLRAGGEARARRLFRVSLLYLTGLFAALGLNGGA